MKVDCDFGLLKWFSRGSEVNLIENDAAFLIFVEKSKRVATFMLGNNILHVIITEGTEL